ncbi:MAG: hypothetical protein GIKADHBN_00251 [Phycisphaerales bacterium]|nr:hypothetical protein [Phycisphaerales bacterium]
MVQTLQIPLADLPLGAGKPPRRKLVVGLVEEGLELLALIEIEYPSEPEPIVFGVRRRCLRHELEPVVQARVALRLVEPRLRQQVQVETLRAPRLRIVPPLVLLLHHVGALEADEKRGQPLLTVQHQRQRRDPVGAREGVMRSPVLGAFEELVDLPLLAVLRLQLPEEERADGVAPEDRIEELHNLLGLPPELSLDRRKEVLPVHPGDGFGAVAHGAILQRRTAVAEYATAQR